MRMFRNDYSEGAAPEVLQALVATNDEQTVGYTEGDAHCEHARELIRAACGRDDVDVEFCIGGTSANVIGVTGLLRDWEGAVCTRDAHINVHETGAVAACGRTVLPTDDSDGFLSPEAAERARILAARIEELYQASDAIADALFQTDLKAGKVRAEQKRDLSFYTKHYLDKAHERAKEALAHPEKFARKQIPDTSRKAEPSGMRASREEMRAMMQSGKLPDGRSIPPEMMEAMRRMGGAQASRPARRKRKAEAVPSPEEITFRAKNDLLRSSEAELASIVNAFNGGYLAASPGGDPVLNPETVPTGKNLYGIDPDRTPTRECFAVG